MRDSADLRKSKFQVGSVVADPLGNTLSSPSQTLSVEPKVMDLLVELASDPDSVQTRADLLDRVWGNHGGDESLTKAISSLRRSLAELAPGEAFVETIPKRGYRLLPPVETGMASAPVQPDAELSAASRPLRPRPWLAPVFVLLGVALAIGAVLIWTNTRNRPEGFNRIAVAEITAKDANISSPYGKPLQAAMLRELALSGLESVPASGSVSTSLRVSGFHVQTDDQDVITIQIEDTRSTRILWSKEFELGDEADRMVRYVIPWAVGDLVSCGVSGNEDRGRPLNDPVLVGFLIRACNELRTGNFDELLVQSRNALAYAPDSNVAKVRYAIGSAWASLSATSPNEHARLVSAARQYAEIVLQADPASGIAHYARGVANWSDGDLANAQQDLWTAFTLAPDYPFTLNALSSVSADLGYTEEALDLRRQAVIADPFSLIQRVQLAYMFADRGDLLLAQETLADIEPISPDDACLARFQVDYWWGEPSDALEKLNDECISKLLSEAGMECSITFLHFRLGLEDADTAFSVCRDDPPFDPVRYAVATGHIDEAFELDASRRPSSVSPYYLFRSDMAAIQHDPRFMKLAARYGLVDAWKSSDHWPDFCTDPSLGYDCKALSLQVGRGADSADAP